MRRREFLKASALGAALFGANPYSRAARTESHIEILLDEPLGVIAPGVYGHMTEQLGGVIYDGVWVGEHSSIPNIRGVRKSLVDALREIKAPVIRWPGGCFADSYDWRDGVGLRDGRPRRTNFWEASDDAKRLMGHGVQIFESNAFGTNEFADFCHLSGAEPYFAANLRSLSALDFDHWVEYCNSPAGSTTLADLRAATGSRQPLNVRYWGIGNESWGCGGNFTPEDYAAEFRRYATWVPSYGEPLRFVASGASDNDIDWTHRFFEKVLEPPRPYADPNFVGWSIHHYAWNLSRGKTTDWVLGKGDALQFDPADWYELFHQGDSMERIITDQWAVMSQYDPDHRVRLVIDEYGPWYREGSQVDPTHILGQQVSLRDAVFTAFTLDTFNRHPEKILLCACAQLINNLNALFLSHEDKFIVTPNYYVFEMYAAHQGGQGIRAEFSSPSVHYTRDGKPANFWGLKGSVSRRDNVLALTVVNPDILEPRETEITIRGATAQLATVSVLTNSDIHAHNTFDQPNTVQPEAPKASVRGKTLAFVFPPASVTKINITLG